jgi:simple sugar transport system ATP-binding protein
MFHGKLSEPLNAAEATREKLGLLMGGASANQPAATTEASDAVGA